MHSKLLQEALQKEETRAIVIEVEEGPEEPGEDEEFYAANFELLPTSSSCQHISKLANTFLTAPSANANTFLSLPTLF